LTDSFLELMHLPEAVGVLLGSLGETDPRVEEVSSERALDRVLARDLTAPEDLPGFQRSTMDGYAVRASDTFGASEGLPAYLEVAGEVPMGAPAEITVGAGQAARISTGGVLPVGADAVVMVENTELSGATVEVVKGVAPGDNTVQPDEDVAKGTILFSRGQVLGPAQIGALAGLGINDVSVFIRPLVAILATGDELVPSDEKPGPGQVRDINTAALSAAVIQAGGRVRACGIAGDDFDTLLEASRAALRDCDVLLISGGSSAGVRDLTVDVLRELGKPGVLAHGIYLKPGKPTLIAVCDGKPVLGLPGNPASALAVFREVVLPLLKSLGGEGPGPTSMVPRVVEAVIERSVSSAAGRLELVPVSLRMDNDRLIAAPVLGKSSLIGTLARADGQVRIPEGSEGLEAGQTVTVELLE
jgi:molybdopterin molybdotransferase